MTFQSDERENYTLESIENCDPVIAIGLASLQEARHRTLKTISQIEDPAMLDYQPAETDPVDNSMGTLLYHIAAIELDWLQSELWDDQQVPEAVLEMFPYGLRDESGRLTYISGAPLSWYLARLTAINDAVRDIYSAMTLEDYLTPRNMPNFDVTPAWVLVHLAQHEAEHRAEIAALIRQFSEYTEE